MTEQQIMKEMLYKGIHSITVQSYKGERPTTYRPVPPGTHLPELEWLDERVDEIIKYGRKK